MDNIFYLFNPWWENQAFFTGVTRGKYLSRIKENLDNQPAILLIGSRRVGKTTLIYQTVRHLLDRQVPPGQIVYLPMDHPNLQGRKILDILEEVRQIHGLPRKTKIFLFLDEVQFFPGWEQAAKAIVDFEKVKLVISGSASAKILAKGTFLTGRTVTLPVGPFDFAEFVALHGQKPGRTDIALLENRLRQYLQIGGYPEYAQKQNPLYFSDLITNVVNKDISHLFAVRNTALILQVLNLLADRVGYQTSFTKLGAIVGLTKDTVRDYIYFLSATFLVSELPKYSPSRNVVLYSPKKFYLLDTGLLFNLAGKLNLGAAAENVVCQKLSAAAAKTGFYYEDQKEVDFVVDGRRGYEVKYELSDPSWEKFAQTLRHLPRGKFRDLTILTSNPRRSLTLNRLPVKFERLSEFLYY